jgi:hypothetical protein
LNKRILITVLALGILASTGYLGSSLVLAADNSKHDTLVTRIAEKFNLNKADVEAVFDAVRDEKIAEMQKQRSEKLSDAVTDGVITEDQKNLILSKMDEKMEERKINREEMQKWFTENDIDAEKLHSYLRPVGEGRGKRLPM